MSYCIGIDASDKMRMTITSFTLESLHKWAPKKFRTLRDHKWNAILGIRMRVAGRHTRNMLIVSRQFQLSSLFRNPINDDFLKQSEMKACGTRVKGVLENQWPPNSPDLRSVALRL